MLERQLCRLSGRIENLKTLFINEFSRNWSTLEKESLQDSYVRELFLEALADSLLSSRFRLCPHDYYDWPLAVRKSFLGNIPSEDHLCKSLVLQNTKYCEKFATPVYYEKYYCCVIQYVSKLNSETVSRLLRQRMPHVPRKYFNFQFAYDCENITGYKFNAVTPLGMSNRLPVIVSHRIVELDPPYIWLGGGREDIKWFVNVSELLEAFSTICGMIDMLS
eukprot:jgi/Galph1/6089/GphlegSOOS_G4663.1